MQELVERIKKLPLEQRVAIGQQLLGGDNGLMVVVGQSGSTVLEEDFDKSIENIPLEILSKLMLAISRRIAKYTRSQDD
jgi:hypothetical protein